MQCVTSQTGESILVWDHKKRITVIAIILIEFCLWSYFGHIWKHFALHVDK